MNILFTRSFKNLRMGGVTVYVKQLVKYLDYNKFNIINLKQMDKKNFIESSELLAWNNIRVKTDLLLFYLFFPIYILINKPDVIHTNPSLGFSALVRDGFFLFLAKIFRIKTIVFIHGWDRNTETKLQKNRLYTEIFKKSYNHSDVMVVLAEEFRQQLYKMGFTNSIVVETTMVDDDLIPIDKVHQKIERLGLKKNIKILFLSRMERTKGIYEALDAFIALAKKHPKIELDIAGDGPELSAVKTYIDSLETQRIHILGYVTGKKKQEVFLNSDIYLFPTYYGEGMPISLLEAMAFGNSVITRNEGGIQDFFINGKNGFITDSKSPKVFADLIDKLINDRQLLKKISQYNFSYACENFFASKVTKRIENIYQNLAK